MAWNWVRWRGLRNRTYGGVIPGSRWKFKLRCQDTRLLASCVLPALFPSTRYLRLSKANGSNGNVSASFLLRNINDNLPPRHRVVQPCSRTEPGVQVALLTSAIEVRYVGGSLLSYIESHCHSNCHPNSLPLSVQRLYYLVSIEGVVMSEGILIPPVVLLVRIRTFPKRYFPRSSTPYRYGERGHNAISLITSFASLAGNPSGLAVQLRSPGQPPTCSHSQSRAVPSNGEKEPVLYFPRWPGPASAAGHGTFRNIIALVRVVP